MAGVDVGTAASAAAARAAGLDAAWAEAPAEAVIAEALRLFAGEIAVVSSFGAESAVLLDLVAEVDRSVPVLFVDTDKLFGETLRHRDRLVARLGLADVRTLSPDPAEVAEADPKGGLWAGDADRCCGLRKVRPLALGLAGFSAWISGRKRFQSESRAWLPVVEADGERIKVNPLARWRPEDLAERARVRALPVHPLVAEGYPSIGCMPCTDRVAVGEDARAGRWRGREKTECGIHLGLSAKTGTDDGEI